MLQTTEIIVRCHWPRRSCSESQQLEKQRSPPPSLLRPPTTLSRFTFRLTQCHVLVNSIDQNLITQSITVFQWELWRGREGTSGWAFLLGDSKGTPKSTLYFSTASKQIVTCCGILDSERWFYSVKTVLGDRDMISVKSLKEATSKHSSMKTVSKVKILASRLAMWFIERKL